MYQLSLKGELAIVKRSKANTSIVSFMVPLQRPVDLTNSSSISISQCIITGALKSNNFTSSCLAKTKAQLEAYSEEVIDRQYPFYH